MQSNDDPVHSGMRHYREKKHPAEGETGKFFYPPKYPRMLRAKAQYSNLHPFVQGYCIIGERAR